MDQTTVSCIFWVALSLTVTQTTSQGCSVDLFQRPDTGPLILKVLNNSYYFPEPSLSDNRSVDFDYEEEAIVACPGGQFTQLGFNTNGQHGSCKGGTGFMVAGYLYLYHRLNCTLPDVKRPALSESYDNPNLDDTDFIHQAPSTYHVFQIELSRVDVQSLYRSVDSILASLDLDGYINDTHFIKIGNLAPYEHFFYIFQRDATYHLANSAPQWNTFDEGNWKVVEQGVLDFSQDAFVYGDATVLTGTLKVATLANSSGVPVEIYLYYGRVPVPRWFWKLIYYDDFNVGVIFFGFNNPYASKNEVDTEFLTEVCSVDVFESAATSWHLEDVDNTDPALGYIYACRVNLDEILDPLVNSIVSNVLPMEIRRADIF